MDLSARLIALYLPQFHPIPENDEWWGCGFTEWTNTAKARPLFKGHYQPHVPGDLGFYDLRLPESRQLQADIARSYGIEGFCYYHYWFGGRRILERPFQEVLNSSSPQFPFCLCWANETWTGIWHGSPNRVLIEQTYPGVVDHQAHFNALLPAFQDSRYLCVSGKPIFVIYKPEQIPNVVDTLGLWRKLATNSGLAGLYIVGMNNRLSWNPLDNGFDAKINLPSIRQEWISRRSPMKWLRWKYNKLQRLPNLLPFKSLLEEEEGRVETLYKSYPCLVHAWDNTPRSGSNGVVLTGAHPEEFRKLVRLVLNRTRSVEPDQRLVFLKSWNEWAEGNHLEPDLKYGFGFLEVIKEELARLT